MIVGRLVPAPAGEPFDQRARRVIQSALDDYEPNLDPEDAMVEVLRGGRWWLTATRSHGRSRPAIPSRRLKVGQPVVRLAVDEGVIDRD